MRMIGNDTRGRGIETLDRLIPPLWLARGPRQHGLKGADKVPNRVRHQTGVVRSHDAGGEHLSNADS